MISLKEKLNDLFIEHGYDVKESERSLVTTCPQCSKEKHFYVFKETGFGKCMKCGTSFSPEAIVVALTDCSWGDARKVLNAGTPVRSDQDLNPSIAASSPQRKIEPLHSMAMPANFLNIHLEMCTEGKEYITTRGVSQDTIDRFDLRYCGGQQRVIFPVTMDGICVGWQGRDITGLSELRYMSPPGFNKGRALMGYDLIEEDRDYVVLTEGPVDCLKTAILRNAVCSMGKDVSNEQIELIRKLKNVRKVYLALDPDAFMLFDKIAQALEPEQQVFIMQPPAGRKDFGDCTTEEVLRAFCSATRYGKSNMLSTGMIK